MVSLENRKKCVKGKQRIFISNNSDNILMECRLFEKERRNLSSHIPLSIS